MRWTEAVGREVVDTSTAEVLGRVDALVVDPSRSQFTGVVVGQQVILWTDAGGVGADAMTIADSGMLRPAKSDAEVDAVEGRTTLLDRRVFSEGGVALGEITDVEFDPDSGSIEKLVLGVDSLAGSRLLGVGSFAVIVSESGGSSSAQDIDSLTKAELYEMAQERDIEGRSSMTKAELLEALG